MNTCGKVEVQLHEFLTSALAGSEWSASSSGHFTPGKHRTWNWVGYTAGLDAMAKGQNSITARAENW